MPVAEDFLMNIVPSAIPRDLRPPAAPSLAVTAQQRA